MDELENLKKEVADLKGALNYERSERKRLTKELSSRAEDDSEEIKKAEAEMRAKLKEGKSQLSDETIDDLMATFGTWKVYWLPWQNLAAQNVVLKLKAK